MLQGRGRWLICAGLEGHARQHWRGQGAAVGLAASQGRDGVQHFNVGGYHVGGQATAQFRAQTFPNGLERDSARSVV